MAHHFQPSDGAEIIFTNDLFSLGAYVGFTGLLNSNSVSINGKEMEKRHSLYTEAPPFVLASVTAQFPYLFGQQSLSTNFYAAIDVHPENKKHHMYATALLNGPIGNSLFYILSTSLGLTKSDNKDWQFSNLSSLEISTYLPLSSMISWKTVFATGDTGMTSEFETFTVSSANMDESLNYAGNIKTGIVATMRPVNSILLFAGADVFLNVMNDNMEKGYAGTQWTFSTRWQIVSDVQLSISAGQFFSAKTDIEPYMMANLKLLVSF